MKKGIIISLVITLIASASIMALSACSIFRTAGSADLSGYVAIDINPSVEFITGKKGKVSGVRAANGDAAVLLSDLNLVGMDIEDAVETVVEASERTGYLSAENNDVSITVGASDQKAEDILKDKAESGALAGSDVAVITPDETAKALQAELDALKASDPALYKNLTVAKLKLAKSIAEYDSRFTPAMAANAKTSTLVHMLHEFVDDYVDMIDDEMELLFEQKVFELTEELYKRIDAFYGEEYMAKAPILRQLEILEEGFEVELEKVEITRDKGDLSVRPARFDDDDDDDDFDDRFDRDDDDDDDDFDDRFDFDDDYEILTQAMIDELTAVIGEHTMTTLDELEDYIDALEDRLEYIEDTTVLTREQKAEIAAIKDEIRKVKFEAKDLLKDVFAQHRAELRAKKQQLIDAHR